jgi:hypothetical protein
MALRRISQSWPGPMAAMAHVGPTAKQSLVWGRSCPEMEFMEDGDKLSSNYAAPWGSGAIWGSLGPLLSHKPIERENPGRNWATGFAGPVAMPSGDGPVAMPKRGNALLAPAARP